MKSENRPDMSDERTEADYQAFVRRWRLVNEYESVEMRSTPVSHKLKQLAALMASSELFPRDGELEQDAETWSRWNRLRQAYRG